jgi:hypothetical protein
LGGKWKTMNQRPPCPRREPRARSCHESPWMKTFEEQRTLPEIGRKHLLF